MLEVEDDGADDEHGEEHGEEHHVPSTTKIIALLLMGFLFVDMGVLHLVHWRDANIRSYVYCMISATMSIFCAVLVNQAVSSFIIEQILEGKQPRGFGIEVSDWHQVYIGALLFVLFFTLLNVLCHQLRGTNKLPAVEDIGAHLTAFAGVRFFGWLQWVLTEGTHHTALWSLFWSLVFAVAFIVACMAISSRVRRRCSTKPILRSDREEDEEEEEEFRHMLEVEAEWFAAVKKAENEAFAIILSFLTHQVIVYAIIGKLHRLEEGQASDVHEFRDIRRLFASSLVALFFLILTTYIVHRMERGPADAGSHKTPSAAPQRPGRGRATTLHLGGGSSRSLVIFEQFLAMLQGWTTARVVYWFVRKCFTPDPDDPQAANSAALADPHMAQVVTAGVVTVLAVVCTILLDFIADRINDRKAKRKEAEACLNRGGVLPQELQPPVQGQGLPPQPAPHGQLMLEGETSSESSSEESSTVPQCLQQGSSDSKAEKNWLVRARQLSQTISPQELRALVMDDTSLEKALRTVITGLSLLVGVCWEKAFDASDEAVVQGFSLSNEHPVIAKAMVAFFNVAAVLPAWLWYMVPMAKIHWREHQAMMDLEALQANSLSQESHISVKNFIHASDRLTTKELIVSMKFVLEKRGDHSTLEMEEELQALLDKKD